MAQTAGGTYYAASSELVSSWPATSLDLANQLESRFAAKAPTASPTFTGTVALPAATTLGGKNFGMILLGSGSTSAGTTINFTSLLSTTYDTYRIVISGLGSTTNNLYLRMRSGSSDATGANYDFGYTGVTFSTAAISTAGSASATAFDISRWATSKTAKIIDITNAAEAVPTTVTYSGADAYVYGAYGIGIHKVATAYDGVSLYVASGTMTATARLYAITN